MSCIGTLISPELNVQLGNNWLLGNIQTAGLTFVLHWPPLAAGHWVYISLNDQLGPENMLCAGPEMLGMEWRMTVLTLLTQWGHFSLSTTNTDTGAGPRQSSGAGDK